MHHLLPSSAYKKSPTTTTMARLAAASFSLSRWSLVSSCRSQSRSGCSVSPKPTFAGFRGPHLRDQSGSYSYSSSSHGSMADPVSLTAPNGRRYSQPVGLFINNRFVPSQAGDRLSTINPA